MTNKIVKEHELFESGMLSVLARPEAKSAVDRDAKIIRGVKIVGLQSVNTGRLVGMGGDDPYSYSLDALREAIPLYENCAVNIDHPSFSYDASGERHAAAEQRKVAGRFGKLVNVRVDDNGLYGDLKYLESHPLAAMVCEAAENMPEVIALSHVAFCNIGRVNGKLVVKKINRVKSVDLTAEKPGTTVSLFESIGQNPEESNIQTENKQMDESAMGGEVPEVSAEDQALEAQIAMIRAALKDKDYDKAKKVIDAFKKLDGGASESSDSSESSSQSGEGETTESAGTQPEGDGKLIAEIAQLKSTIRERDSRDKAREMLESAGILRPSSAQVKAVAALSDEKDQKELIESFDQTGIELGSRPRSAPPASGADAKLDIPADGKSFARSLR